MEQKGREQIMELAQRLKDNKYAIRISRVPIRIKKEFIALANDEFCGDYGMLLKALMDGVVNPVEQEILLSIRELESRIILLEANLPAPEEKEEEETVGRRCDGLVKRRMNRR